MPPGPRRLSRPISAARSKIRARWRASRSPIISAAGHQGDGLWYLGVPLASRRIADRDGVLLRTGLRSVIERWRLDPVLTPGQDIILTNIEAGSLADIET